jgi:sirohydrochlorin ferrochelatase
MMMKGFIFFAHGSSIESANEAVRKVAAEAVRQATTNEDALLYQVAFLELSRPTLEEAAETLINQGVDRITVVPYFLTLGIHLQRDLPAIVNRIAAARPGIQISVTPPLDGHPGLASLLADRARHAI